MTAPLSVLELNVAPDWIDYNGHMNDAYYAVAFSRAGDAFLDWLGFDAIERAATKRSTFTLSLVIRYVAEAKLGERIALSVQVLECDAKRMRYWLEARRAAGGALIATSEQVLACVDLGSEKARVAEFPSGVARKLNTLAAAHGDLPVPLEAGQGLTLRRRSTFSVTP